MNSVGNYLIKEYMSRQNRIKNAVTKIHQAIYELSEMNNSDVLEAKKMLSLATGKLSQFHDKLTNNKIASQNELNRFNQIAKNPTVNTNINTNVDVSKSIGVIDQMIAEQKKILEALEAPPKENDENSTEFPDENLNG